MERRRTYFDGSADVQEEEISRTQLGVSGDDKEDAGAW